MNEHEKEKTKLKTDGRDEFTEDREPEARRRIRRNRNAETVGEKDNPEAGNTRRIEIAEQGEIPADGLQRADSRVPAEARRMAAAPYGTARPEHRRPGTRPLTAAKRPTQAGGQYSAREPARERIQVGYAPGRMSDRFKRQMPGTDELREEAGLQDRTASERARAYLERRGQPFRGAEPADSGPARPASRAVKMAVIGLLIVGVILTGVLIMRNRKGEKAGSVREAPKVFSFEGPVMDRQIAPLDLTYTAVTDRDVEEIQLTDEKGAAVGIDVTVADNANGKAWVITQHLEEGFTGVLHLEVRRKDEDWHRSEQTVVLSIASGTAPGADGTETQQQPAGETPESDEPAVTEPPENTGKETPGQETPEDAATPEPGTEEGEPDPDGNGDEEEEEESGLREDSDNTEDASVELGQSGTLATPKPTPTPAPVEESGPVETPPLEAEAAPEANPDLITNITIYNGNKKEKDYNRPIKEQIHMPVGTQYTKDKMGVMTFRGDNFRRNGAVGELDGAPTGLRIEWDVEAGSSRGVNQTYYGYGWPGQPAIVKWSKQVRPACNLYESKLEKQMLKEVIIAGLDGNIRFLDLEDGSLTRNSIKLGYPMTGTPSIHSVGAPFMSVGQFARKMKVKTGRIGLRQYNLYNQKEMKMIDGLDGKSHRPLNNVGSFETSALVDRTTDNLIVAGSNGVLYLEYLNSGFDYNAGVMSISPSFALMTSKTKGQKNTSLTAVESSLAAYDKYVYYADMGGVLRCVDTNTLRPVWAVETGDAVMAAVALDLTENRELNLYTANMFANRKKGEGKIQIRCYDALSGRENWCTDIGVYKGKKDKADVGAKASPVIGANNLNGLVYFTVTGLSDEGRSQLHLSGEEPAALIALEKASGDIVWSVGLDSRTESSPVAVYDTEGNGWIIQCEQDGTIWLLDGLSGREVTTLKLDAEIIASPAVYNDMMVLGTTGKGTSFVYGIKIIAPTAEKTPEEGEAAAENAGNEPAQDGGEQPAEDYRGGEEGAGDDEEDDWVEGDEDGEDEGWDEYDGEGEEGGEGE